MTAAAPLTGRLASLADRRGYQPVGQPDRRWGQLLRSTGEVARLLDDGRGRGVLVPLRDLVDVRGGTPTRANAYFLVTELPFGQEPARLRLTRADYQRLAVVLDGLDVPARIERAHLRPALKGPEALRTPTEPAPGQLRVFAVDVDEATLRRDRHTGALAYLRRGQQVDYSHGGDALKGGVPASRSNVRDRRPYWHSLGLPPPSPEPRLVFAEHVDQRYPVTLLDSAHRDLAVIDKLYVATPKVGVDVTRLLAAMSSVLTWVQLELRGRTQLGQGVLEVKKPDWAGVLVLRPDLLGQSVLDAFAPLSARPDAQALSTVQDEDRAAFDEAYLAAAGEEEPAATRAAIALELLAAVAERRDRRDSVRVEGMERRRQRRTSASVDAYAARLAARLEPYPDPRQHVPGGTPTVSIAVRGPASGTLTVGEDLFTANKVLADGDPVAETADEESANYVLAVLSHDPALEAVEVPVGGALTSALSRFNAVVERWWGRFDVALDETVAGVTDPRVRAAIRVAALSSLHAPAGHPPHNVP